MSVDISLWQVTLAAALMLISLLLSYRLKLGLERDIILSSVRMTVQLLLVGLILGWIFALKSPWSVLGIGLVMTALAAQAATERVTQRYSQVLLDSFISVFGSALLLTGLALSGLIRVRPWFEAQYAVPVLGMVLGNTLTGVSLALERFTTDLSRERPVVEGLLALGATRWEAAGDLVRRAVRTGMTPTLNSMAVMGVVSLPGMMTGQILAGASPLLAVRYQIVIMFVLATSCALGSLSIVLLAYHRLFDDGHRLRAERLYEVGRKSI